VSPARILAATDFSEASTAAVDASWVIARHRDARLTLFHVDELPHFAVLAAEPVYVPPQAWDALSESYALDTARKLDDLRARLARTGTGANISTLHRRGDPVEEIVTEARESDSSLLVVGTHGQSGSLRYLFGSVAAKVSRTAPCPVLVTNPDFGALDEAGFRRALVAVDFSAVSNDVVRAASELVGGDAHLTLVHVWREPAAFAVESAVGQTREQVTSGLERMREDRVEQLGALASSGLARQASIETVLEIGTPAHSILELADRGNFDLIVVGSHSRETAQERVLGTVADRVLRNAKVPVLLVPRSPDA